MVRSLADRTFQIRRSLVSERERVSDRRSGAEDLRDVQPDELEGLDDPLLHPVGARELDGMQLLEVRRALQHLGDLYTESSQTLQGSFSAVSKPKFARKYSCESSRRDLHNALLCTALQSRFLKNKSSRICEIVASFYQNC